MKILKSLLKTAETIRQKIKKTVLSLPENPKIKVLSTKPKAFVVQSKALGDNWTAEYHSFSYQYEKIVEAITAAYIENIPKLFEKIREEGYVVVNNKRINLHPRVIENIKNIA